MKALSIRQPWAWAILHAGKNVENRSWKRPWAPEGLILLHASGGCTEVEYQEAARIIERVGLQRPPPLSELQRGGLVGAFRITRAVRHDHPASPWAEPGLVHLHLADVQPVNWVPLRGQLGFFDVPDAIVVMAFGDAQQASLFGGE